MVSEPLPPVALTLTVVGDTVYEQEPAAWSTVNVEPATVSVAERVDGDVFAATVNATAPFPLPFAPDVIVIQLALLVAAHAQPEPAVTAMDPEPPLAPTDWLVGLIA